VKRILRIFLVIFLIAFFGLGSYILYEEFFNRDVFSRIEKDSSLLIPIILTLLSFPSFLFNLGKLFSIKITHFYKWLLVLDLIFSILLFFTCILGFYFAITVQEVNPPLLSLILLVIIFLMSILLFF